MLRFFDPAEPGFLKRMGKAGLFLAGGIAIAALLGLALWSRGLSGRYWTSVILLYAGLNEAVAERAGQLIEDDPDVYMHYRLRATALRRSGDIAGHIQVFQEAAEQFPNLKEAQGHYCWYGTLFDDPASVMPACDRAVEIAPLDWGHGHGWRAVARGVDGDLEGARADLQEASRRWGGKRNAYILQRRAWLEALEAGQNPFDEQTLEAERSSF